jgi:hypothetical protein
MTDEEALKIILSDIKQSKNAKKDIDAKIDTWIREYQGEVYGNERDGYSKLVVKDIKKAVEWFIPNAVEPFVKSPRIVALEGITAEDVERAKMHERLLNHQFIRKFDRYAFIHDMMKVSGTEGTTNIRCGWKLEEEVKTKTFEGLVEEELRAIEDEGMEITELKNVNGKYNVTVENRIATKNDPDAKVLKNEDFFPDPSATCIEDSRFCAERFPSTIGELRASNNYTEAELSEIDASLEKTDSELGSQREQRRKEMGGGDYESLAEAAQKVTVYEYFGWLDLDDDGIEEPIMATIINDKLLQITDNPYPDKELPYVSIPFSKTPFSFWGEPLAEFLSDNQKIRTSIMRGIIDNISRSNNGKKFIKKGSLDAVNKRRYENNLDGLIEYNGESTEIFDGEYNQIAPSVFNLYEVIQQESEGLSGINRTMQGTDSRGINDSATGAAIQQDMSQKRMMDIIRRHADGLEKVFRKWISYNKEFLTDEEVMRINGEFIPFTRDDISGEFDINITVGTDGVAEAKVNQMTMLMQQVGGLSDVATIPDQFFNMMLAKIADEWGYVDVAQALETALEAQKLQIEELQAKIEEIDSKTQLNEAKAVEAASKANETNLNNKMTALGVTNDKAEAKK